jgi:hypothetical protein
MVDGGTLGRMDVVEQRVSTDAEQAKSLSQPDTDDAGHWSLLELRPQ